MNETRTKAFAERVPVHFFFLVSAVFHYLGPAFAVLLFSEVDVVGVAWLRIATAAVFFAVWRRPWVQWATMPWSRRRTLLLLGIVLGVMNICFYVAISRIPLGTVGAIEFIGPVALAAFGVRNVRNISALLFAAYGGFLLTDVRFEGEPVGFMFAFANCLLFLLYIILGHKLAQDGGSAGVDRLGGAMAVALVVVTPLGFTEALPALTSPSLLLAGIGVGVCSSVIPYITDQLVMARVPRATFALLLALLPVFGSLIGAAVLMQIPTVTEVIGVLLVTCGVALYKK